LDEDELQLPLAISHSLDEEDEFESELLDDELELDDGSFFKWLTFLSFSYSFNNFFLLSTVMLRRDRD
jgi:hypothetical protein